MIQTTIHDVVFRGHGGVQSPAEVRCFVPDGVEFWMLAPPGAGILNSLATMLETGEKIDGLIMRDGRQGPGRAVQPLIYHSGDELPDLMMLHTADVGWGQKTVPHIIIAAGPTHLQYEWNRINPFLQSAKKAGRTLRVFWGACSDVDNQAHNWLVNATNPPY